MIMELINIILIGAIILYILYCVADLNNRFRK